MDREKSDVDRLCRSVFPGLKRIIRSHLFFHLFFAGLVVAESALLVGFALFRPGSAFLPFPLVCMILTIFIYLIALFYLKTKKPQQFRELQDRFMSLCKRDLPTDLSSEDYHLTLANAAYRFAERLKEEERTVSCEKVSDHRLLHRLIYRCTRLCYDRDFHKMKELLLSVSVREHILLIRQCPMNLEAHGSLANAYIDFASIYHGEGELVDERCAHFLKKAVEEFKVMDRLSPENPWIQARLAPCYRELDCVEEEMRCYEKILARCPDDRRVMFNLGVLYFKQGKNAQGLKIYQDLKRVRFSRADELIALYEAGRLQAHFGNEH
ncbi:MAG: hypothetical protein OXF02_03030 [Simkaniaceae bacterium]|nr:hypothetical protein [Simkaniaceae bacterium]